MQFKKCAVVGVLITLYLSTDSWCHYIPEKKTSLAGRKNATSSEPEKIQICGNALTDLIIKACNGVVNSLNQANSTQTKIAEDCCNQECPREYFQSYCGETPLFTSRLVFPKKSLKNLTGNRSSDFEAKKEPPYNNGNKGISEVRIPEKKNGKRKWGKSKKRKRSFKLKCAFKSFGHYLLKLERGDRVRDSVAKGRNTKLRRWPSIQIGTISPEMDKFGGQPIVVLKKNKSNSA